MNIIDSLERTAMRLDIPPFKVGDTVRVQVRISEGDKERIQNFDGVVIRRSEGGLKSTFTVRKVSYGIGVERTFLVHSPRLEKVQIVTQGRVRQARLYYLRALRGKAARIRERRRFV